MEITAQQLIDIPDYLSDSNLAHEINGLIKRNRFEIIDAQLNGMEVIKQKLKWK